MPTDGSIPWRQITDAPAPTTLVPLTTTVGGVPDLVWDDNDQLVLVEVPL